MARIAAILNIESNAQTAEDLNKEIGQLKMVIGFVLAKLPRNDQNQVINELREWGLKGISEEFDQFVHPNLT